MDNGVMLRGIQTFMNGLAFDSIVVGQGTKEQGRESTGHGA
jgi:hypothetical protein